MPNRLIHEQSPYLRQHANNPVDWYPWGEEAFRKAKDEEKPIFLSIGYSTCHWCHVMERESFEDASIASYLNEHFVSIKVDREERPDVDHLYMAAVQAMSGSGGWPMTLFLTAELKPFFGGTYFPPVSAYGRPSFRQLIGRVHELWETERISLVASSETLMRAVIESESTALREPREVRSSSELADLALQYFEQSFDTAEGGFGNAPKFPRPVQFDFLFYEHFRTLNARASDMAIFTLKKMAEGGIRDHLAGGFHRYSVDRLWRVSHFEKMLYDQAQLVNSYLDAYQVTKEQRFASVAEEIVEYVLRDMTHKLGAFFSAEDADSEGEEGTFYVWRPSEIDRAVGSEDAELVRSYFGITEEGNFEDGKNVLYIAEPLERIAKEKGNSIEEVTAIIERATDAMNDLRAKRTRPNLDDKVLTSWNGLMIGAVARAGVLLKRKEFVEAAAKAGNFIWSELYERTGMLLHRWRDGDARYAGYLEDFAFLIHGYLDLYRASFDTVWLERAVTLQAEQDRTLYDTHDAGYYLNRRSPDIPHQSKDNYDGAEPSGNSISVLNLFALYQLTGSKEYLEKATATLKFYHSQLDQRPYAMPEMLVAAQTVESGGMQIVLAGELDALSEMLETVADFYLPHVAIIQANASTVLDPFYASLAALDGRPTAYICKDYRCELPITSSAGLREALERATSR